MYASALSWKQGANYFDKQSEHSLDLNAGEIVIRISSGAAELQNLHPAKRKGC